MSRFVLVLLLVGSVAFSASNSFCQSPPDPGGGGADFAWCYKDANISCADAVVYLFQEGLLPPTAKLSCNSCSPGPVSGDLICDDAWAFLPLPNASQNLDFATSDVYYDTGRDSVTTGQTVACGQTKQCTSSCVTIQVIDNNGNVVSDDVCQTVLVSNTMPIEERTASGNLCPEPERDPGPPLGP